jgi:hypothetical protein
LADDLSFASSLRHKQNITNNLSHRERDTASRKTQTLKNYRQT